MDIKMERKIIDALVSNWNRCGMEEGDLVLVHSSLKCLLKKLNNKFRTLVTTRCIKGILGEDGFDIVEIKHQSC